MSVSDDAYKDYWEKQQERRRKFGEKLRKAAAKNREKIIMEALSKAVERSTFSINQLSSGLKRAAQNQLKLIERISGVNNIEVPEEIVPDEGKEIIGVVKESNYDPKTGKIMATIEMGNKKFALNDNKKEQEERKPIDTRKLKRKLVF